VADERKLPDTPADSPLTMEEAVAVNRDLATAKLAVGDPAFHFDLPLLDGDGSRATGETVSLAELGRDRPVALVFGSYT
jgi:hypothetical protein